MTSIFTNLSLNEITKYAIAGVMNTCVGYAVFWVALRWMGFEPAVANSIGYVIALFVSFLLNKIFVFTSSQSLIYTAGRFTIAFGIAFSLNQFVLFILLSVFLLSAEIAQIFAMAAYTLVFYFLSKYFVFVVKSEDEDMINLKSIDWLKWLFIVVVALYAITLPIGANFGLIDDHGLLSTLLSGQMLDYFIRPKIGRFYPLDGQEYNIISHFSLLPSVFYVYNMVQFLIVVVVMLKILDLCFADGNGNKKSISYGIVLLIIFSPGFVTAWFRLFVPERGEVMFFLIFFLMYLLYQREQKYSTLISGIVAANIALYYKEPGFLMLGAFGFFHLVFGWKMLNMRQKLFDVLIMASATIFIVVYFFVVFLKKGPTLYGDTPYNPMFVFVKAVFNNVFMDPFLMVLMFGLLVYRFYEVLIKKDKLEPVYDAALLAGAIYVLVYLKLNMESYHYLLPAYTFATFGMAYFLIRKEYFKRKLFKTGVGITLVLYVFNALPVAVHLISFNKNVPNTFQNTLVFLTNYIDKEGGKVTIYLDGVDRGNGIEAYKSFAKYLNYKGVSSDQFDFKSDIPSNNSLLFSKGDPTSPFTVYRDPGTTQVKAGDLLVITPYTAKFVDQKYLNDLKENYDLLYHAESILDIPKICLKSLIKYMTMKGNQQSIGDTKLSNNFFNWSDFYVFQKKHRSRSGVASEMGKMETTPD